MKHIAYLCLSKGWGGLEMNQLRNAKAMQDRGHLVMIIGQKDSPIIQYASKLSIPYYIVQKKTGHYQWAFAWSLSKVLLKKGFDHLIFRNNREMSLAASIAFFSFRKIRVHYFMEMALGGSRTQWFRTLRYVFFTTWVCPLPYLVQQVKEKANVTRHKIKEIPSGITFDQYHAVEKTAARQKLLWPLDAKLIVVVGRIDPKKRQDFVWEMFSQRQESNEYLIFVGASTADEPNTFEKELQLKTAAHPKGKNVIWAGFKEEIELVYAAADLIIMPAAFETFGMATLEALYANCPVVGANNGGTAELINLYHGGCLFEYDNPADLNLAINRVLSNEFECAKRKAIQQHFDLTSVCSRIEKEVLH